MNWHPGNKAHYESLGYVFTKMRGSFVVSVHDLPPSSAKRVKAICDKCGVEREVAWRDYRELCAACAAKTPERRERLSCIAKEAMKDIDRRQALAEGHMAFWTPEKRSEKSKKQMENPENRELLSEAAKQRWQNPEYRAQRCEDSKRQMSDPARRIAHGLVMKQHWTMPAYRASHTNETIPTAIRLKRRSIPGYADWRKAVYERDNFTCQCCGKRGGLLNAHHVFNFRDYPELATSIENGVTLCKPCHDGFHRTYGRRSTTRSQYLAYLASKHLGGSIAEGAFFMPTCDWEVIYNELEQREEST